MLSVKCAMWLIYYHVCCTYFTVAGGVGASLNYFIQLDALDHWFQTSSRSSQDKSEGVTKWLMAEEMRKSKSSAT